MALAAFGPAAAEAIAALVEYPEDNRAHADYAPFCIRGGTSDLEKLLHAAQPPVSFLNALGVAAAPVAEQVRQMLQSEEFAEYKDGLELFLEKVEKDEGPFVLVP